MIAGKGDSQDTVISPRTYLALPVDSHNSVTCFVRGCHKYSVPGDTVHVDTGPGLYVVQVDVPVFRYHVK